MSRSQYTPLLPRDRPPTHPFEVPQRAGASRCPVASRPKTDAFRHRFVGLQHAAPVGVNHSFADGIHPWAQCVGARREAEVGAAAARVLGVQCFTSRRALELPQAEAILLILPRCSEPSSMEC